MRAKFNSYRAGEVFHLIRGACRHLRDACLWMRVMTSLTAVAIVCAVRPHGEHGAIVRALTPTAGIQECSSVSW